MKTEQDVQCNYFLALQHWCYCRWKLLSTVANAIIELEESHGLQEMMAVLRRGQEGTGKKMQVITYIEPHLCHNGY